VDFRRSLALVASALGDSGGGWALIGGLAVGLLGVPRTTVDVDLLVRPELLPTLDEALTGAGYVVEYRWEESSHYRAGCTALCAIDVIHAHRPHALSMLKRAGRIVIEDEPRLAVPVVAVEDLIGLKVQAMVNDPLREAREVADMRALLEVAASGRALDGGRLRSYFELFDRTELLTRLLEGLDDAVR
jgi:hypothetical protein